MSINHFSTDLPETLWWTQQQQQQHHHSLMEPTPNHPSSSSSSKFPNPSWNPQLYHHHQPWLNSYNSQDSTSMFHTPNTSLNFNLNHDENEEELDDRTPENPTHQEPQEQEEEEQLADETEKEAMFEKPLTPSDVGKLNRLVIPKQHAEKYFPLGGESSDKGLLLSFEDEAGKCWRFRYSYWNSSQSYVLTKGWSRFVKDKRLDAGDVVLFERHRSDGDRLFIGWRRRGATAAQDSSSGLVVAPQNNNSNSGTGSSSDGWTRVFYSAHPYPTHHHHPLPYQPDCLHAGSPVQNQTTPVGNSRVLRLFGVNMECQQPDESEPSTPDGSSFSNQGPAHQHLYNPSANYSSNRHDHMDITFSRDVNQMRNRRG